MVILDTRARGEGSAGACPPGRRTSLNAETRPSILAGIVMATSVHIPQPLLEAVDRKARALKMSRNRLIVRALERELTQRSDWSPGFFEQLSAVDPETVAAVDELLAGSDGGRLVRTISPAGEE